MKNMGTHKQIFLYDFNEKHQLKTQKKRVFVSAILVFVLIVNVFLTIAPTVKATKITTPESMSISPTTIDVIQQIFIKPVASFTFSNNSVPEHYPVSFDASGSSDPDGGSIVSYVWDFGDGTTGTGVSQSHSYSSAGTKTVILTVTDNDGLKDSTQKRINITTSLGSIGPDIESPNASAGNDMTVGMGSSVTFDSRLCTDNVGIVSYEWDFGDGTVGTGKLATHTYTTKGDYAVTLKVTDAAGNYNIDTLAIISNDYRGSNFFMDSDTNNWRNNRWYICFCLSEKTKA